MKKVPLTYYYLRQKLDWEEFCDLTGTDYYARRKGAEFNEDDIYYIDESKAKLIL